MQTCVEGPVDGWPRPDALWNATFGAPNNWRDRFVLVPRIDKGGMEPPRYYAVNAAEAVLDRIADGGCRATTRLDADRRPSGSC